MNIQEFKKLYFKNQLRIFNDYQQENCLDGYIYENNAYELECLYSGNLESLLRDISNNNYRFDHDYFSFTIYGLETFDRPKAQEIINDTCADILFRKWLEDYNY